MKKTLRVPVLLALAAVVGLSGCKLVVKNAPVNNGSSSVGCTASPAGTTGTAGATAQNTALPGGTYAFTFTGTATATYAEVVMAGTFISDGMGNITGGEEDINILADGNDAAAQTKGAAITGNYMVGSDGRGTLNFTSVSQTYKFNIENGNHGQLIRFDCGATGSGTFDLQSASTLGALQQGNYAFEWNGAIGPGLRYSGIGNVSLSGSTAVGAGDFIVEGGYGQGTTNITLNAPDANGHGTATIVYGTSPVSTDTYGYDIVSATRVLLIETDDNAAVGEMDAQATGLNSASLSGAYAFLMAGTGSARSGSMVGRFLAVSGMVSSSDVVENPYGEGPPSAGAFTSATYSASNMVQSTPVNGRFVFSATDPSQQADTFVIYLVSSNQAFLMETDLGGVLAGQMLSQPFGNYTAASLNGNYGIAFSGNATTGAASAAYLGQFTSLGTTSISAGTLDINISSATPPTAPGNALSVGSYTIFNANSGHGTMTFVANAVTHTFDFYFVSPSQIFVQEKGGAYPTVGVALSQPAIP